VVDFLGFEPFGEFRKTIGVCIELSQGFWQRFEDIFRYEYGRKVTMVVVGALLEDIGEHRGS